MADGLVHWVSFSHDIIPQSVTDHFGLTATITPDIPLRFTSLRFGHTKLLEGYA